MFWSCERGRVGIEERAAARWAGEGEGAWACIVIVVAMSVVGCSVLAANKPRAWWRVGWWV